MDNCPHCQNGAPEQEKKTSEWLDPVCGMTVKPDGLWKTEYNGGTYHFCSEHCLKKFTASPESYVKKEEYTCPMHPDVREDHPGKCPQCGMDLVPVDSGHSNPSGCCGMKGMGQEMKMEMTNPVSSGSVDKDAIYTCPMHPEIRQDHPGTCPLCGMALEPEIPTVTEGEDPELKDFRRRFFVSLPFSLLLLLLGMGGHLLGGMNSDVSNVVQLILSLPVVLWAGAPLFVRGWRSVITRNPNMWTLIILGTTVAFVYSLAVTFFPEAFPAAFYHQGHLPVYYEAAALILSLALLGQIFELKARSRTSDAIRSLLNLSPDMARVIMPDGTEKDIPLAGVHVGDKLRVRPGEKVPVDGRLLEGNGDVDESMITGESVPVTKAAGQNLIGGTLNTTGSFIMQADHVGGDTVLARIVNLVAQAQRSRAPIQRMVDVVARYFVGAVISIAAVTFLIWGIWGPAPSWDYALINAVSVLIIACPCALGLATPMSVMVASGKAATLGVLFRDAAAMEELSQVDTLVIDKTGTLTEGKPGVTKVEILPDYDENAVLARAAALERGSEHPLSRAVVAEAETRGLPRLVASDFKAWPGGGVSGMVEQKELVLGTEKLCSDLGGDVYDLERRADVLRKDGDGIIFLMEDRKVVGLIAVKDQIKPDAVSVLNALRQDGIRIVLASGDAQKTVDSVARELSLREAYGAMTPEKKLELVKKFREEGRTVAMAGDGVNDAPALAEASVGIAMGTGTDIAMQSGSVTLVKGDLKGIERAYGLACATLKNMKSNLWLAFAYNALGIPLAAGVLYPFFGILLSPVISALAMSLSSVSVILNALRLRNFDKRKNL